MNRQRRETEENRQRRETEDKLDFHLRRKPKGLLSQEVQENEINKQN